MARGHELEARGAAWRELAWAGAVAAAIVVLLVVGVGLVWLLGRTPSTTPALIAADPSTPTPRALSFVRETQTPDDPVPAVGEGGDASALANPAAATPELLAVAAVDTEGAANSGAIFSAPAEVEFAALASGTWSATSDLLANDGKSAVAEPWLKLGSVPGSAFAVEAEMRVTGLLESVCDQSFGLVAGNVETEQRYGGGLLFPCAGTPPSARLTGIASWEDGYNADTVIAEKTFDPGDEWHTYRFEVRGDRLRFIVDGVGVVSGSPPAPLDAAASEAEAGLWSQGVGVEVRQIAIFPLPS
jgi:hypothetical protein